MSLCMAVQWISIAILTMITGVNSMLIVTLLHSWRLVLGPLFFEIALILSQSPLVFNSICKKESIRSSKCTDLFMRIVQPGPCGPYHFSHWQRLNHVTMLLQRIAEFIFSEFASSTSNSPPEEGSSTHEAGSIFFAHLHLD